MGHPQVVMSRDAVPKERVRKKLKSFSALSDAFFDFPLSFCTALPKWRKIYLLFLIKKNKHAFKIEVASSSIEQELSDRLGIISDLITFSFLRLGHLHVDIPQIVSVCPPVDMIRNVSC